MISGHEQAEDTSQNSKREISKNKKHETTEKKKMGYFDLVPDFSVPVQALYGLAMFWSKCFPIVFL